ncbi:MAG: hypothetical protein LBL34_06680 [Clostridiales bacterium]|jgi:hypothetical protein|nr:hypothetical protein [Clostridiales bacterium]
MRQDKLFNPNRTQPARAGRRKARFVVLGFFAALIVLFVLSFVISYNLIAGANKPNTEALAKVQELTTINDQLMAEISQLRIQLDEYQKATPQPTATRAPSATPQPTAKATQTPSATVRPTTKPTVEPTKTPVENTPPIIEM